MPEPYAVVFPPDRFPHLNRDTIQITGPPSERFNCIAWAAGDDRHWWEPHRFWPQDAPKEYTLDAYMKAFESIGYQACEDSGLENGFDKIVLYVDPANGRCQHAARQLPSGHWTSKMGRSVTITHNSPEELQVPEYGYPMQSMKRPKKP